MGGREQQGVTNGSFGSRERDQWVAESLGCVESSNIVARTSFNAARLLPNERRFEHGGAKLVSQKIGCCSIGLCFSMKQ